MAITKMSNSGIATGGSTKYDDMLAGNPAYIPSAYESLATINASGTTVSFTSIPSTYASLQIRFAVWTNSTDSLYMRLNSDSGTNYAHMLIRAAGVTPSTEYAFSQSKIVLTVGQTLNSANGIFFCGIIDIHDYASTTKTTTVKYQTGKELNSAGITIIGSGLWTSTAAVSSISFSTDGGSFQSPAKFALYGIEGS